MNQVSDGRPELVHVPVSHFSEKARWALDYKRVPHVRRWPWGGLHPLVSLLLTRGRHHTVPVLVIEGEAIGDSTAVIRRLEERYPQPPLYPPDPVDRRRALELEDFFDEELGPYVRRMAYHHLTRDPELLPELTAHQIQYARRATMGLHNRLLKTFVDLRFSTGSHERAEAAERKVSEALDRLDAELDGREYLTADGFSVADLTAASLLYPLVRPPQTPWQPSRLPDAWIAFEEAQRGRPSLAWAAEMYRRHRG
jgi:glutathione S-transferase